MKNSRFFPRLTIEALQLDEDTIRELKGQRFRTVQDIISFGVPETALLCGGDHQMADIIRGALDSPPQQLVYFSERTPFKSASTFEEEILYTGNAEFLQTPTSDLAVSARGARILGKLRLKTIADVINYGLGNLTAFENIGEFTRKNVEKAIMELMDGQSLNHQAGFRKLLHALLPAAPDRCEILKARFGFETGRGSTLREIGQRFGMSIERIRKIIMEEMRRATLGKAGIALSFLRQRISVVLITNGHIAAIEDIASHRFFENNSRKRILFLVNILAALFPKRYRIIEGGYLTSLSPAEVARRKKSVSKVYSEFVRQMISAEVALIKGIQLSPRYVLHCLGKGRATTDSLEAFVTRMGGSRRGREILIGT
jgi:hypothetical protein